MSEGFNVHFPAMVGETMYLLTYGGGEIRECVVEGYIVYGCSPYKICVRLSVDGKTMYRRLASVGRTIFANRQSAEVAAKTEGEKL
jgi:hypothetical protein